ncbi:MAG: hypothetical protein DRG20_06315 [Deltaproteobacteria bacterium]|nr:GntR family transcriptional regulator [Deltaproteobacteria bacterium]RLA88323.1 MAG: hypothetical protein DRG20_06315 [Deltaproteobacteria bacterium]
MGTLKEDAYIKIREGIVTLKFKPGQWLHDTELSKLFNIGRTPIREALIKLEQEGFVKSMTNKGFMVSEIDAKGINELYEVRAYMESLAVRRLSLDPLPEKIKILEDIFINIKNLNDNLPLSVRFNIGQKFHRTLIALSENELAISIMDTVYDHIERVRWLDISLNDRFVENMESHLRIIKLIKEGDTEGAEKEVKRHVFASKDSILKFFEQRKNLLYL